MQGFTEYIFKLAAIFENSEHFYKSDFMFMYFGLIR